MMIPPRRNKVIVIGGGIHGCATAYFLAKRGQIVTIIERDHIARHASGVNAGGVRSLGRDLAEIPLSLASMDIWNKLHDEIGAYAQAFHPSFYLKVAIDEEGYALGSARAEELERAGYSHEIWLESSDVQSRLPKLTTPTYGGFLVEGDGWAIPWQIVRGFAQGARQHGAEIIEQCNVFSLELKQNCWRLKTEKGFFEADYIVNCAGAWAAELAFQSGEPRMPLAAYAPMLAVTERKPPILPAVIGVLGHTLSVKQIDTGQFVIGGGVRAAANLSENSGEVVLPKLVTSMRLVAKLFADIAYAQIIRCWSGIEGYMPDNLPIIGHGKQPGLIHGFGFSAHGFQLGPAVGEALADLVMDQQPRIPLDAFRPDRF